MKSHRATGACLAVLLFPAALFGQNAAAAGETVPSIAASELEAPINPFTAGSQSIGLGLGLQLPFLIIPAGSTGASNLHLGGSLGISYQYFIARGISLGGSLSGSFNGTIGGRSYFMAPLAVTAAYWWSALPFEFSLGGGLGAFISRLDDKGMIGPFAKLGGGAFWRSTSAWSIGLQPYVWIVPEIHSGESSGFTRFSAYLEASITAVYHL